MAAKRRHSEDMDVASTREARDVNRSEPVDSALRAAIFAYVVGRVRDHAAAEDLTQNVLIRAVRRRETVRNPERMDAWVFGVARNAVADYFRAARPTEAFNEAVHGAEADEADLANGEDEVLRRKLNDYVRGVVEGLPRRYREALIATEYEGLSQAELARQGGLSVSTVKSRVQRGRAMVRAEIERCCRWETDRYGAVIDCLPKSAAACDCNES
jgi:RNA polymerase sigma-70 factor (ECF subfamily)